MEPLVLKLKFDRSEAKQQMAQHLADARKMADATKASVEEGSKATNSAMDRQRDAMGRFAKVFKETTDDSGQRIKGLSEKVRASASSFDAIGTSGSASFGKVSLGIEAAKMGLNVLLGLAKGFTEAMERAGESSRKFAQQHASNRDKLGELATVMGEKADNAFTQRNAQFNTATGFRDDEGLAFRLQFNNSGQQSKGSRISESEYSQYEQQAAQLTAAKGFDPDNTGDLAGSLLGFKDRRGLGDKASEDALGKLNSGLAILGRGKGRNSVLVNQFNMAAAGSLNEDELKGAFQDSDEVAAVISTMAEKHDASSYEMMRAANRGLRGFDDKDASPLLKKAGVTPQMGFIDAMKAIAPHIEREAKEKNLKTEDVLGTYFKDQQTREAIAVGINRGVSGGVFDDRTNFGKANSGPKIAMDAIGDYQKSERGQSRIADAQVQEAELDRGAENSQVDILRKQALARLIKDKRIDTTNSNMMDYVNSKITFSSLESQRQTSIDEEVGRMLNERSPEGAKQGYRSRFDSGLFSNNVMDSSPEGREKAFRRHIGSIQAGGGDAMMDRLQGSIDNLAKKTEENTREMQREKAQQNPQQPATQPRRDPARPPDRNMRP